MPNLDGGHYFLTVLAPIRTDTVLDDTPGRSRSHRGSLAQKLALMATGRQTAASPHDAWVSPFSKNTLNHLARFVIIDDPAFNGRHSDDTLVALVRNTNPLVPQPVDRLSTPFLLFAADIDAHGSGGGKSDLNAPGAGDAEAALKTYTAQLWATMDEDIEQIFGHCVGFAGINTAAGFHEYIKACQIETTMPFNDYWPDGLDAGDAALPTRAAKAAGIAAAAALAIWLLAIVLNGALTLFGVHGGFARLVQATVGWGAVVVPLLIIVLLLALFVVYRWVMAKGAQPFPTAPGSDLPTVLKSLFLQQQFVRLATEAQGLDDAALHSRFGAFLAAVRPGEATPTQAAGEMASPRVEWTS